MEEHGFTGAGAAQIAGHEAVTYARDKNLPKLYATPSGGIFPLDGQYQQRASHVKCDLKSQLFEPFGVEITH